MNRVKELGRRIELVASDPHFHDISIALHRATSDGEPAYQVNSYSSRPGAEDRLQRLATLMVEVGGLSASPADSLTLTFPCGGDHELAARRVFIESCKLDPAGDAEARPLEVYDKKVDRTIRVTALGEGSYHVFTDDPDNRIAKRVATVAAGLVKLAGMEPVGDTVDQIRFTCGHDHHMVVALLLVRALNARGVLREMELAAARGMLSAPSQQK